MAEINVRLVIDELKAAGLVPADIDFHVGSSWGLVYGPSTLFPEFACQLDTLDDVPPGIHLPLYLSFKIQQPSPDMHPYRQQLLRKAAEELALLKAILTAAGLPDDDMTLARFIVLHEIGHWEHYRDEGIAPFVADLGKRREALDVQAAPHLYRQLPTEEWADAYALAQLKVFYARQAVAVAPRRESHQRKSLWRRIVALLGWS